MEKLTRILAVVDKLEDGAVLLEKAVALARRFGARVDLLLHESLHSQAFATLCSTLRYDEVTLTSVHRGACSLQEIILRRVGETLPDLVIKAPAGAHPLRRWTLGPNDRALADECPVPVMLVRHEAWAAPIRFAAAVDVADDAQTETARSVLHAAGFLAFGCKGELDVLYGERERDDAARAAHAARLRQLVNEFRIGCERLQVLDGEPAETLPSVISLRQYDVLVLGASSHQPPFKTLFGTMTNRMVEATVGDVVLVKAPARDLGSTRPGLGREQLPHDRKQFR